MTCVGVNSGCRASSTAAAALTCGAANDVPITVPSAWIVTPAGASSDDPVGASERGTVVMMPTPGAAMSLNTGIGVRERSPDGRLA